MTSIMPYLGSNYRLLIMRAGRQYSCSISNLRFLLFERLRLDTCEVVHLTLRWGGSDLRKSPDLKWVKITNSTFKKIQL